MSGMASRRELLSGLAAGSAGTAIALATADAADAAAPTVRGTWIITPKASRGSSSFRALAAFAAGGVFATTGTDKAGTGLGEWSSKDGAGFEFTYLNFHFGAGGRLATTVKVSATGTFSGSRLTGRARLTTFGPRGNRLSPDARFTFTGTRLEIEAP